MLDFVINKQAFWMGYSLDKQTNVTVTGNDTITGLAEGMHNITVYAKDENCNIGASETIIFAVEVNFATIPVVAASAVTTTLL